MAQENVGFDFVCPQAADRSYGALVAGQNVPYTSVANALTAVTFRYRGKTVLIDPGDGSGAYEYWWRVGIGNNQLVPKILYEQRIDFFIGDGGANTPGPGSTTYPGGTNPGTLINCLILGFGGDQGEIPPVARTGFQSYQYNPTSGLITLVNTKFSTNAWFYIKFRQL